MSDTKIPYADKSWNVTVGDTHAGSSGCDNCWAKELHDIRHKAYLAGKKVPEQYSKPFGEIVLRHDRLDEPLHWRKPCRIFVCSMSDLFNPSVPFEFIEDVYLTIRSCPHLKFLIFTKRIKRLLQYTEMDHYPTANPWPKNVQIIVSCSTQKEVDENVPILLQVSAAVRGISLEPLIEEIELHKSYLADLHWIIVGCESGKNRRPCKIEWVRKIVQDCQAAGVAVYVKQLEIGGKVITDINQFPEDLRIREYPEKVLK